MKLFQAALTATSTKKGYVVALYINGVGNVLMFLLAMIAKQTLEFGIGRFRTFGISHDNQEVAFYTPQIVFCLVPFYLLTLLNGMRCFRDRDKRRKSVWYWYLYMKGFLILGLFGVGIYALIEGCSGNEINKLLKETMNHYDHSYEPEVKYEWDKVQLRNDCCGVNTYSDWQEVSVGAFRLAPPSSCCLRERRHIQDCGMNMLPEHEFASRHINTKGCYKILFGPTEISLKLLGALMILLSNIHIVTLLSTFLFASVNKELEPDRVRATKELQALQKMYEPDTTTRNRIYRQHLYMDHSY